MYISSSVIVSLSATYNPLLRQFYVTLITCYNGVAVFVPCFARTLRPSPRCARSCPGSPARPPRPDPALFMLSNKKSVSLELTNRSLKIYPEPWSWSHYAWKNVPIYRPPSPRCARSCPGSPAHPPRPDPATSTSNHKSVSLELTNRSLFNLWALS